MVEVDKKSARVVAITEQSEIRLFPNPVVDGNLTIQMPKSNESRISIYNLSGKLMHQQLVQDNQIQISVEHLQKGVYILRGESTHFSQVKKFIVR